MRIDRGYLFAGLILVGSGPVWPHGDPSVFQSAPVARVMGEVVLPPGARAGVIATSLARNERRTAWLHTYGQVVPDYRAVTEINSYISGEIRQVYVRQGDAVKAGSPVVAIYSPEFIATQTAHMALLHNREQLNILREEGRLPNYLKDAKENLAWWGMTGKQIDALVNEGKMVQEMLVTAKMDGIVTDVFVQPGTFINTGDQAMKAFVVMGKPVARMVADNAPRWIDAYIFPDRQALLSTGNPVKIQLPDGKTLERNISQVLPGMDDKTQRRKFRIDLGRGGNELALGAAVNLDVRFDRNGIWVPREAVMSQGIAPVVYVEKSPGHYDRTPISVLDEAGDAVSVKGIVAGARVVTEGKMILEGIYRMSGRGGDSHHHDD